MSFGRKENISQGVCKKEAVGGGEMARQLRSLAVLSEELSLLSSTNFEQYTTAPGDLTPSSGLDRHVHASGAHRGRVGTHESM